MPIRFRCAYCSQLMAIARRKAGTVVQCPKCSGQVIVPPPEPEESSAAVSPPPASALEVEQEDDFEKYIDPPTLPTAATVHPGPAAVVSPRPSAPPLPVPMPSDPTLEVDTIPLDGIVISRFMLIVSILVGLALFGISFLMGFFFARYQF